MPDRILFQEWRAERSTTKYPFGDRATLTNRDGFVILEGTFLDGALYPVGGQVGMYLSQVAVDHQNVTLWIGDPTLPLRASVTFPLFSPPALLTLHDVNGIPAGILVSEPARLGIFQSWATGTHVFTSAQTPFAATVCMPTPASGLQGILLDDGTLFTGDVYLVGDDGVVVREDHTDITDAGQPYRSIRIDVVGDPLFRRRLCQPESLFVTPNPVKSLRVVHKHGTFNVAPDASGNVQVSVNNAAAYHTVLRVRTTAEGVVIEAVGSAAY